MTLPNTKSHDWETIGIGCREQCLVGFLRRPVEPVTAHQVAQERRPYGFYLLYPKTPRGVNTRAHLDVPPGGPRCSCCWRSSGGGFRRSSPAILPASPEGMRIDNENNSGGVSSWGEMTMVFTKKFHSQSTQLKKPGSFGYQVK